MNALKIQDELEKKYGITFGDLIREDITREVSNKLKKDLNYKWVHQAREIVDDGQEKIIVMRLGDIFIEASIPYDSWEGCYYSDTKYRIVEKKTKTIEVYE